MTFSLEAGRFIRGQIRRELKAAAVRYGVDLEIEEDKGFFESLFICTATGPMAVDYVHLIQEWIAALRKA